MTGYKVLKGKTLDKAELDSSWPDLKRAKVRKKVLDDSYRGRANQKMNVWVIPMESGDKQNYRKSTKNKWTGYNDIGPKIVK